MISAPTVTLGELAAKVAKFGAILVVGVGVCITGAMLYSSAIFPHLRPERALSALFKNPQAATVLHSEQHGAFMIGNTKHTASATVTGQDLKLQPYMQSADAPAVRQVIEGWHACAAVLRHPAAELRFYQVSGTGPGNLDSYVAQHRSTHTYCLIHVQF